MVFKLVPAPFNADWLPYARAFYAAKKLGVVERTHLKLFDEKFAQHYPINSLDDLADFYAREGVNRAEFMRIATSPEGGGGYNVTFPARQYSVNGERRTFALLRPIVDTTAQSKVRELILQAYQEYEEGAMIAS